MTLDVYADLFDDDLDAVAKAMESKRKKAVKARAKSVGKIWAKTESNPQQENTL